MYHRIKEKIKNILRDHNSIHKDAKIGSFVRIKGSSIGRGVKVDDNTSVEYSSLKGQIQLGKNNQIGDALISGSFRAEEHCKIQGAMLSGTILMGRFSSLWGPNLDIITGGQKVIIGNFCSIARNVSFQTYNHNHKKITSYYIGKNLFKERWTNEKISKGDISVKNDVWIGAHSVLLGGVTIHNGAIVAANSVVTKDVPAFSIVAGTPAKVIGYRFKNELIDKIEQLKWWDWSIDKIENSRALFENEIDEHVLDRFLEIDQNKTFSQ